jgi:DNA-3-methyladenine glycosylase II
MEVFQYGQAEIEHLKHRDKKLAAAMDKIGMIEREVMPDLFGALVKSIVSQRISRKAAQTVWKRLCEKIPHLTPRNITRTAVADMQLCGLPVTKANCIRGISDLLIRGELDFTKIGTMTDHEIIKALSSLPGIGIWTAEMLLIFSLCRPDVVSWGDFAIRRGMMNLYGLKELTKEQFDRYRKRYSPYGSVASLYLWALSSP